MDVTMSPQPSFSCWFSWRPEPGLCVSGPPSYALSSLLWSGGAPEEAQRLWGSWSVTRTGLETVSSTVTPVKLGTGSTVGPAQPRLGGDGAFATLLILKFFADLKSTRARFCSCYSLRSWAGSRH